MIKANNKQLTVMYHTPRKPNLRSKNPAVRKPMSTDTAHDVEKMVEKYKMRSLISIFTQPFNKDTS
jgi:hypothetical protein